MKLLTLLVSSLATLAIAAPASDNKRAVSFDPATFNNLKSFQQVNLNYLLNINSLQLSLLGNLASVNNLDILQFQALFQRQQAFDVDALLQLQALQTFLQIHQLGVLSGFDLGALQLGHLNLGLLGNVGVLDLGRFVDEGTKGQVKIVADEVFIDND